MYFVVQTQSTTPTLLFTEETRMLFHSLIPLKYYRLVLITLLSSSSSTLVYLPFGVLSHTLFSPSGGSPSLRIQFYIYFSLRSPP